MVVPKNLGTHDLLGVDEPQKMIDVIMLVAIK